MRKSTYQLHRRFVHFLDTHLPSVPAKIPIQKTRTLQIKIMKFIRLLIVKTGAFTVLSAVHKANFENQKIYFISLF
ncbi:hypothetical protein I33_1448 [Bacillus subtilis subsp. subtilis str. RO-NN-1]|nr:hypothetical protein I33_1448 [Bacillus subtilis subsp. subtilis str. RO-NN-1]